MNPYSEKRMELILKQMMESPMEQEVEAEMEVGVDEVSIVYYGENCNCSKTAKCKLSKCLCYIRNEKCTAECHSGAATNCTNK